MKFRWSLALPQPLLAGQLASKLKISPLLAQCLVNRGFSEPAAIENFLSPRLKNLADPFLLPNMTAAVERLFRAREQNEALVIFGDYDVDGVTSTALLVEVFRALGWRAEFYLPSRIAEGYGLSMDGVENCLKKLSAVSRQPSAACRESDGSTEGCRLKAEGLLLLAVDCGSTAVETVASLAAREIDVIILDHH
ncbi:MAG: DHH family phosphoesterase, partial [Limisphaerales bacterium]